MSKRRRCGQSLVESALVIAALGGLVLGIAEVGQALVGRQTLADRVHAAARWGALHDYDPAGIRNFVLYGAARPSHGNAALLGLVSDDVQVTNAGCPGVDCRISVLVRGIRAVEPAE
ncbi:MAG TPA: TadE/TadG family type IV pilus assembly protein [Bryobacteraceae bacterium]|nr:TadE/TadG family type IV pilus assembly protein [Bryobacteraceae bacterium]